MRFKIGIFISFLLFFSLSAGYAADKKKKNMNLVSCQFSAQSIAKPTVAGINLYKKIDFTIVSEITNILAGNPKSVPFDFILNMQVTNPNTVKMTIHEIEYILLVDNVEFTRGTMTKSFSVPATRSKSYPLPFSLDLAALLKGNTGNAAQNLVKNFMGNGSRPSNVTVQLKPSYKIDKEIVATPRHIPVSFTFQRKR